MKIVVSPRIENSEFMTHLGELPIAKYLIKKTKYRLQINIYGEDIYSINSLI